MSPNTALERLDPRFRHGSITAIGVIAGFSLSFLCAWASDPKPWQVADLFAAVPMCGGILLQIAALAGLFSPKSLDVSYYLWMRRLFLAGLVLVIVAIAASLLVDVFQLGRPRLK